VEIPSAI